MVSNKPLKSSAAHHSTQLEEINTISPSPKRMLNMTNPVDDQGRDRIEIQHILVARSKGSGAKGSRAKDSRSEAYRYISKLITKSEEEVFAPIPTSDSTSLPLHIPHISFHTQLFHLAPHDATMADLREIGKQAAAYLKRAQQQLVTLLEKRHKAISEGRQPPSLPDARLLEAGLAETMAVQATDVAWASGPQLEDFSQMKARIEQLVEMRWGFKRRIRQLREEKAEREGARRP
nr:hypothetical protein CFP56_07507 [Quercus suber]